MQNRVTHPMLRTIHTFLTPPVFPDDPEKTSVARIAYILMEILWGFLFIVVPVFVLTAPTPAQARSSFFIDGSLFIIIPILLSLVRRGRVRLASLVLTFILFLTGLYFSLLFQESLLGATVTWIAIVIIGAQLLGEQGVWIYGGLGLISQIAKILAAAWGWHMDVIPLGQLINDAVFSILQFLFFCILLGVSMRSLAAALERSHRHEQQLEVKNQALKAEIARHQQAVEALSETEERYRSLARNLPDSALILFDQDLRFLLVEGPELEATGFSRELLEGKTLYEALPADFARMVEPNMRRAVSGETFYAELPYEDRMYRYSYVPLHDHAGEKPMAMILAQHITERKQMENALIESRNLLQTVLDTIPVRIFWKDKELNYLGCNRSFALDGGATSPEELIGKDDYQMGWQEQAERYRADDRLVLESGLPKLNYEEPQSTPDGRNIWLRTSKVPLLSPDGNISGILGTYEDITEYKQAEEALRQSQWMLQTVLDQFPGVVYWKDRQSVYLGCNEACAHAAGLAAPEEIVGKTDFDLPWATTQAITYQAEDNEVIENGKPRLGVIEPQHRADGKLAWLESTKVALTDEGGQIIGVLGISRDITEQISTLHTLQETEFFLNRSQEVARIGSYKFDISADNWISSPSLDDILGITNGFPKTAAGWLSLVAPQDLEMMREHLFGQVLSNHQRFEKEYRIIRPIDGKLCWMYGLGELEFDDKGNPVKLIGTIQDINERKLTEIALQQAGVIVENSPVMLFRWKAAEGWPVVLVSQNVQQLGYAADEFLSGEIKFASIIHPDDLARVGREVQTYSSEGVDRFQQTYRIFAKDGKIRWLDDQTVIERNAKGEITHFQGIVVDITEQKQAQDALRASERRLQQAISVGNIGVFDHDHITNLMYSSPELKEKYGIAMNDQVSLREFQERIHPDDRIKVGEAVQHANDPDGNGLYDVEYRLFDPNGTLRWLIARSQTLFEGDGANRHPVRTVGALIDITERRQMEDALLQSQQMLRTVLDQFPGEVYWKDRQSVYLGCNQAFSIAAGLANPAEIVGKNDFELPWAETEAIAFQSDDRIVIESGEARPSIIEQQHQANGRIAWFDTTKVPLIDERGDIIGVLGVSRDITEYKQAEQALRESEEKYRDFVESVPDGFYRSTPEGRYTALNEAMVRILGYDSKEELMGIDIATQIYPNPEDRLVTSHLNPDFTPTTEIFQLRKKDGTLIWLEDHCRYLKDKQGNIIYHEGVCRDITERKLAEERIAASLQEKNILLKEIHHRVKNNLQVISSLLYLQSQKIQDESLLELFRESQNRVGSMALIHEHLYQSDNFAQADFGTYVQALLTTLFESYGAPERQISYHLETYGIKLSVNNAVPCGLLVNEIVSNALKYAFPTGQQGQIAIELKIVHEKYQLVISDNGVGMPETSQIRAGSLGLRLIQQLVLQLGGTLERTGPPGTTYKIVFPI